jgi:hypothetical protein
MSQYSVEVFDKIEKNLICGPIHLIARNFHALSGSFHSEFKKHSERVALISEATAILFNLSNEEICDAFTAGLLHDIGKIFQPKEYLDYAFPMSAPQYREIQFHPLIGFDFLRFYDSVLALRVGSHHGIGQKPYGLEYYDLVVGIIAVTDCNDARINRKNNHSIYGKMSLLETLNSLFPDHKNIVNGVLEAFSKLLKM